MHAVLSIDQGTTGTRALIVRADGTVAAGGYRSHEQHYPNPGWVEHDPHEIWAAVLEATDAALADAHDDGVSAIAIANQGETVLAWDRKTGEPFGRAIVWQDTRTQASIDGLARDTAFAGLVRDTTGLVLDSYFSATKLRWLLDHSPEVRAAADRGSLVLSTLDAWLLHKLTGGATVATDASTAARTLLMSLATQTYAPTLLDRFGIDLSVLPEIRASDAYFGDARALHGRARGVPIYASLVDQPAALFGHGCLARGTTKATYGTGCFVYTNTADIPRPSSCGLLTTLAWKREAQGCAFALDGGIFAAGSVVDWLRDRLRIAETAAEIDALAATANDDHGVIFVPALAGLAAPHWDRRARGTLFGLELRHGRAEVARAALSGIAFRVAEVIHAMNRDAGGPPLRALRVDGGLTRSNTLLALQANWLGVPVEVSAQPEATAFGAALLAMRSIGALTSDDQVGELARVGETVDPTWTDAERDRRTAQLSSAIQLARRAAEELG